MNTATENTIVVPPEWVIPAVNSEYDKVVLISSLSQPGNNYEVNLYQATCSCLDFTTKRTKFSSGDLRRLCKHLIFEYRKAVDLTTLSDFMKVIIHNGHPPKEHIAHFDIEDNHITVNFDLKNDWWDIFMKDKKGAYKRYGYSHIEKRFSYDDKPTGYVLQLRPKLKELQDILDKHQAAANPDFLKGCFTIIIGGAILIFLIYLIFNLK